MTARLRSFAWGVDIGEKRLPRLARSWHTPGSRLSVSGVAG